MAVLPYKYASIIYPSAIRAQMAREKVAEREIARLINDPAKAYQDNGCWIAEAQLPSGAVLRVAYTETASIPGRLCATIVAIESCRQEAALAG